MGDDADQFATGNDAAFVDDDNDLLGGSGGMSGGGMGEEVTEFESSFPDINTRNEVRIDFLLLLFPWGTLATNLKLITP